MANRRELNLLLIYICFALVIIPTAFTQSATSSRLTATQQLQRYLGELRRIPQKDEVIRQGKIEAFAKLARHLSPRYGRSAVKINESEWVGILTEGFKRSPRNTDVVLSLTQLHINKQKYADALKVITSFQKTNPCHEAFAWLLHAKDKLVRQKNKDITTKQIPEIDVHFCVITSNPKAQQKATLQQLKEEVKILNSKFVTFRKKPIVRFKFKSASFYNDIKNSKDQLAVFGNSKEAGNTDKFTKLFSSCTDKKIRDPHAINFYVYDSYNEKSGFADITSHGRRNSNRPFILIDWQRLNNNVQSPEAHEMGHAFGLYHVAVPGAKPNHPTNIMTSTQYGFGSGGKRDLGFTESQTAIITYHSKRTIARLIRKTLN
jgi:hypothetical protein